MGVVVWLTGLPGSGKSTLASALRERLLHSLPVCIVDGDELRAALVPAPGYDAAGRRDFYASLANIAALLARQGLVVLVPATAHLREFRSHASSVAPAFLEVHVATPAAECARRDPKGLYARAGADELDALPGVGATTYEVPEHPDVVASGGHDERAVEEVMRRIRG